jgi:hypothetical protein
LDQILKKGQTEYTYYQNDDPKVIEATAMQRIDLRLGPRQQQKEAEHKQMMTIAEPSYLERIDAHLAGSPQGLKFNDLKRLVE